MLFDLLRAIEIRLSVRILRANWVDLIEGWFVLIVDELFTTTLLSVDVGAAVYFKPVIFESRITGVLSLSSG